MGRKGFSLIELLVVVSILAVLLIAALFTVRNQLAKARDARRKSDIAKIMRAVEEYEKDNDCYPDPSLVVCRPDGTGLTPYLSLIPCDPVTGASYPYEIEEGSECGDWYRLYANLEFIKDKDYLPRIGPDNNYSYYAASPNAPIPSSGTLSETPTPGPQPSTTPPPGGYFGCKNGVCVSLVSRDECSPNFDNPACNGPCNESKECR